MEKFRAVLEEKCFEQRAWAFFWLRDQIEMLGGLFSTSLSDKGPSLFPSFPNESTPEGRAAQLIPDRSQHFLCGDVLAMQVIRLWVGGARGGETCSLLTSELALAEA